MSKTVLIAPMLISGLLFVLGSSWAEQVPEQEENLPTDELRITDDLARRLAERLSGRQPVDRSFVPEMRAQAELPDPPIPLPRRSQVRTCLAQAGSGESDLCAVAEDLSRMGPCLDPADCPAYEAWKQLYRQPEPRIVPAEPRPRFSPALAAAKKRE